MTMFQVRCEAWYADLLMEKLKWAAYRYYTGNRTWQFVLPQKGEKR